MDKASILFVIDGLEFGGGERTFLQLINGLPQNQYRIHVATSPGEIFFELLAKKDIKLIPLNLERRANPKTLFRLVKIIRENRIDIIHSQGARTDFYTRIAARILKPKVRAVNTIAMPVEGYDVHPLKKIIYTVFDRSSERYVDCFISISDSVKDALINKHKIPKHKIARVYNGIELNEYNSSDFEKTSMNIRKEYNLDKGEFLIGAIGRLVWQKGFEYLIEAAPRILKQMPQARFLIVGDGPLKKSLTEKSRELGAGDQVVFSGFRSDIKEILASVDILVMPSLLEGFPMVTLEGMAMAKPIIASDIDGIREQIDHNENGILVPPKEPDALAKAIIFLLKDRERARELGLSAQKKAEEKFSVEKMISETERVYKEILQ